MPDFATLWPSLADSASVDSGSAWPSLAFTDDEAERVRQKEQRAADLKKRIDTDPWSVMKDKTALPGDKLTAAMAIQEDRSKTETLDRLYYPKKFPVVGGFLRAAEAVDAKGSIDRIQAGKGTDFDYWQAARFLKMQEDQGDYNTVQRLFDGVLESGSFIGDVLATGGISGAAKGAAKKATTELAEKALTRGASKIVGRGAGVGAQVAAQTALMPGRIAGDAGQRYAAGDDPMSAIAKGAASTAVDVGTEQLGSAFTKYLPKALRKKLWINPRGIAGRAGIHNLPSEMFEESASDIAKGATGLSPDYGATGQAMQGNFQPLAETAGVVGLTGGAAAIPQLAGGSQKPLRFDTTQKLPTAAEVNEAMSRPETAQAWATANPEAATRMAAIDSPSRKEWEELTGEKMRGNHASRKAFADNVREAIRQPGMTTDRQMSGGFPAENAGSGEVTRQPADNRRDPRWHYGNTPWKPEPSPESIADTVGTTPIANDPTPGTRQSDVLPVQQPVEQVTEFSTPVADYRLKQADTAPVAMAPETPPVASEPAPASLLPPDLQNATDDELAGILKSLGGKPPAKFPKNTYRSRLEADVAGLFKQPPGKVTFPPNKPEANPQDSQPIQWRDDNSGFTYGKLRGREVTVKQANPFAASSGEGQKWRVLVDSEEYGPDFASHAEAKAHADKLLRHQLMPADHPAKLLDDLSYLKPGRNDFPAIKAKLVAAGVPEGAVDAMYSQDAGVDQQEVEYMVEKYLSTDDQSAWARENLTRWARRALPGSLSNGNLLDRISEVTLKHPEAWDYAWEKLQEIKREMHGSHADNQHDELLRDLMQELEAWADNDLNATDGKLWRSHEYSPMGQPNKPEQRAPVATVTPESANALNQPVSDKTPQPAPRNPAQEAVADTGEIIAESLDVPLRKGPSMTQSPAAAGIASGGVSINLGGIGSWLKKFFTSAGHRPDQVFAREQIKDADVAAEEKAIRNNANDLRDALRKEVGSSKLLPAAVQKIDAALKGDTQALGSFSPRVQKAISAMRAHIDTLSQRLIASGVTDEQLTLTIDENMGSYVHRSYQAHDDAKYQPSDKVRKDAYSHLQAAFPQETAQQINNRLDDMLARAKEGAPLAVVKRSMLGAKDRGILKARKDIAPEIRAFLGEYNDPFINYAKSATKMANLVANQEFLVDVKNAGMGKFFFEKDDPNRPSGFNDEIAAEGSEVLSPLNGLMTTPEIKQAFQDVYAKQVTEGWLRAYLRANYAVKYSKTVASAMTHVRNLVGNVMFAVQNGHWNVPMMGTALKATGGDLAASLPEAGRSLVERFAGDGKAWREAFQRYTKLGIVGDGVHEGELRAAISDVTDTTKQAVEAGPFGYAVKALRGATDLATNLYQLEDAVWKIYAFENERARYKAAYEKAGTPKGDAELDRIAASITRDTYPTYSMLPKAVTILRRLPFIGSFVSFPAEVARTTVKSIQLGIREVNDPALKSIGAQRLAGNALAIALPTVLGIASRWMFGIDDEDEEALRQFLPPWQENNSILWLSKPKNGKAMYLDLSYTMPHSMLQETMTAAMRGEDTYDSIKKGTWQFAEPFISEEILAGKIADIARNTTGGDSKREVYPEFGTDAEKAAAITKHLYGAFEPGTATSARRIGAGLTGTVGEGGKVYNPLTETMAVATGQRIQETDVAQSLRFDASNYAKSKRKTTGMFSSPFQRAGSMSDEKIGGAYKSSETARRAQFDKLHKAATSAIRLGVSEEEVRSILKTNGVSATRHDDPNSKDPNVNLPSEIDRVLKGEYEPYRLSRDLYEHVQSLPDGQQRLEAYQAASGDDESIAELHRIDVTNRADVLARDYKDVPFGKRPAWRQEKAEALQWLKDKGLTKDDVLKIYSPKFRSLKDAKERGKKHDRLSDALGGL